MSNWKSDWSINKECGLPVLHRSGEKKANVPKIILHIQTELMCVCVPACRVSSRYQHLTYHRVQPVSSGCRWVGPQSWGKANRQPLVRVRTNTLGVRLKFLPFDLKSALHFYPSERFVKILPQDQIKSSVGTASLSQRGANITSWISHFIFFLSCKHYHLQSLCFTRDELLEKEGRGKKTNYFDNYPGNN